MSNITMADVSAYCPVCTFCLSDDPPECPECLSPRPSGGWEDIATTSHVYLGKELAGRYVVDRFVGAGTTGDVYRGVGARIQRPFALKIVDTQRYGQKELEDEMVRRLELEVEAMSQLRNPHVVNVYESFRLRDHVFVMVMDFVEGVTLQERLDRMGRLEVTEALEIVRQVANGLHEAHQRGIIHRDLKPDNVMVEKMPASGLFARILDFGIAYMVDSVRRTSGFRGTPLYASPEQCISDAEIGPCSDVYSLGCVLFHCLTGRPPFESDRSLAVMEAHIEADVPSIFDVLSRGAVPAGIDELAGRLLAKDPTARPQDCGDVVGQLDALDLNDWSPPTAGAHPTEPMGAGPTEVDAAIGATLDGVGPYASQSSAAPHQRVVHLVAGLDVPDRIDTTTGQITASALGPGGDYAVLADRDQQVHLVGLKTHLHTMTFGGAPGMLTAVAIASSRGTVYGGGFASQVVCWNLDVSTGVPHKVLTMDGRMLSVDIDARGSRLAIGTDRGLAQIYDLRTEAITTVAICGSPVSVVQFVPGANRLFVGCWEGPLKTVDVATGEDVSRLEPVDDAPMSAAVDPTGRIAAVVEKSGQLRLVDLIDPQAYLQVEASFANLQALSFAADGSLNGLGTNDEQLQLWLIRHENVLQHLAESSSETRAG